MNRINNTLNERDRLSFIKGIGYKGMRIISQQAAYPYTKCPTGKRKIISFAV